MTDLELLRIVAVLSFAAMFTGLALVGGGHLWPGGVLIGTGFIAFIVIAIAFPETFPG